VNHSLLALDRRGDRPRFDVARLLGTWRSWTGLVALAGAAYTLTYLVAFAVRPWGNWGAQLLSDFGEAPVESLGVLLALVVIARERRPRARLAWILLAAAISSDVLACLIYGAFDVAGEQPFPSVADIFYLALYPLMFLGLMAWPTASSRQDLLAWRVLANIAVVMLGGGMALIHFVLLPTMGQLDGDPLATIISLAYPAGDMALLAAIATVSSRRPYVADRTTLALLVVTVVSWFFGDIAFAIISATGTYAPGDVSDVIWIVGDLAFLLAAQSTLMAMRSPDREASGEALTAGRVGPLLMLALGLGTLVAATMGQEAEFALLSILAAALTAVVVFRQILDEQLRRRTEAELMEEQTRAAEWAARQARHDPLTGLPNRIWLHERLHAEIEASRITDRAVTLAFLDLNYFKAINDSLGHAVGDELLEKVARRLEECVREGDTIARLGGDEFAIILPATPARRALSLAARARAELERPFELAGTRVAIGGAFGLATYPDCGATDVAGLVRRADTAMYRAKRARLGPTLYEPAFESHGPGASALAELRSAISGDRIGCLYQPIRERSTGRTIAVEAVARWNHPRRGSLEPQEFLPLAMQTGLVRALDARVLDLACTQARRWQDAGLVVRVSVNISRDSLQEPGFVRLLRKTLDRHGLPGRAIELEVTEDGLLESADQARKVVESAHEMGVRTALDDFGTGYSSLGRLRDLPVQYLKIDRSFVVGSAVEARNAAFVEAMVSLAHRLGKEVVAEGVEDRPTLDYLDELGVDFTQGYLIGEPVLAEAITARLRAEQNVAPSRVGRAAATAASDNPAS
jgi:diguanylate cyclase (GGDEF)-like protein